MGKLRIVIVDSDEGYVEGLSDYISSFHSYRFEITTFTRTDLLCEFLLRKVKPIDMLLISPDMYSADIPQEQLGAVALLGSGSFTTEVRGLCVINKYQHVEKIMGDIAHVCSETQISSRTILAGGSRRTRIIGVYSPGGGTGKTTVALCCSIQSAIQGQKVFYLNLEDLPVMPDFFEADTQKNFSRMLYHLKEKSNLALKIDGSKCIDTQFGIHYFAPVEHPLDIQELMPEEMGRLLETFKSMGQYDFVFVDMSSCFNRLNITTMGKCDHLLVISDSCSTVNEKYNAMVQQLAKLPSEFDGGIFSRTLCVFNKVNSSERMSDESRYTLPFVEGCKTYGVKACIEDEAYVAGVLRVLEQLQ